MRDLEFRLKPSRQYVILMMIALVISVIVAFSLPVNLWLHLAALVMAVSYIGYILWRFGLLRGRDTIISLRRAHDGVWCLSTRDTEFSAVITGDSTITGLVSVLRFRVEGRFGRPSCVIFRDSLNAEQYRQLLVLLKSE